MIRHIWSKLVERNPDAFWWLNNKYIWCDILQGFNFIKRNTTDYHLWPFLWCEASFFEHSLLLTFWLFSKSWCQVTMSLLDSEPMAPHPLCDNPLYSLCLSQNLPSLHSWNARNCRPLGLLCLIQANSLLPLGCLLVTHWPFPVSYCYRTFSYWP